MKPFLKVIIVFVSFLLIVSFATNPSTDDFERFLKTHINEELKVSDDGLFAWLLDRIVDYGLQHVTRHQDFKFFSIFTIELPGEQDHKFLGLFTVFIPLQEFSIY